MIWSNEKSLSVRKNCYHSVNYNIHDFYFNWSLMLYYLSLIKNFTYRNKGIFIFLGLIDGAIWTMAYHNIIP